MSVPIAFFFAAIDRFFAERGTWIEIASCTGLGVAASLVPVYWSRLLPSWSRWPNSIEYLKTKNSELGDAIVRMCIHSAWAKCFSAQALVKTGTPIDYLALLNFAASVVTDNLIDGKIEVRGRLPGDLKYESIPRELWRSSALRFVQDSHSIWKMEIWPAGGVEQLAGNIVRTTDAEASTRNSVICGYDSLIVDGEQFEKVWPKYKWDTDRKRFEFLREARRRKLNENEITKLSRDWNPLFTLLWVRG